MKAIYMLKSTLWHLDGYMDEHSKLITSNNFNTVFYSFYSISYLYYK